MPTALLYLSVGVCALAIPLSAPAAGGGAEPASRLVVEREFLESDAFYIEGAVPYVKIRRAGRGELVLMRKSKPRIHRRFEPGRYELISFVRPCSGNCGFLDPPTDRCSELFDLGPQERVKATVRIRTGHHCRVRFEFKPL